jgi:hypothetical protein
LIFGVAWYPATPKILIKTHLGPFSSGFLVGFFFWCFEFVAYMDAQQVLQHLTSQFPGQLVLYVRDIATILGKSEKAVESLIARDGLPFRLKSLGGRRCVDIFQVAEWLALEDDSAEAVKSKGSKVDIEVVPKPSIKRPKQSPAKQVFDVPMSEIGQRILGMRHKALSRWASSTPGSSNAEDRMFYLDLFQELSFRPVEVVDSYYFCVSEFSVDSSGATVKRRTFTVFDLQQARALLRDLWLA